jgi:WD40 repeat protein
VLEGHTSRVDGALALSDGRLLSWSWDDKTLRLWDGQSEACLAVLKGHTDHVRGALELRDGRLLSWSGDKTLRLWDDQSGVCLAVLEGHTEYILGALELSDGRLLSWSGDDKTLRLWAGQSGACLAVLEGHTSRVDGALALSDGRLLSWSWDDKTLRLWDGQSGACLEVIPEDQVVRQHPEWLHALEKASNAARVFDGGFLAFSVVFGNFFVNSSARAAYLRHKARSLAAWNADSDVDSRNLSPDGTLVVTQANGQVCILKLHHGNRRVSLAEVEEILAKQMRKEE